MGLIFSQGVMPGLVLCGHAAAATVAGFVRGGWGMNTVIAKRRSGTKFVGSGREWDTWFNEMVECLRQAPHTCNQLPPNPAFHVKAPDQEEP